MVPRRRKAGSPKEIHHNPILGMSVGFFDAQAKLETTNLDFKLLMIRIISSGGME